MYIDQNTGEVIAEYITTKKEEYKNNLLTGKRTDKELDKLYNDVNEKTNTKEQTKSIKNFQNVDN
jgi:hypothetical protein